MKRLGERFRKLCQLPAGERLILLHAWMLFLLVEGALRLLSPRRLLALHRRLSLRGRRVAAGSPSVARLVWLVTVAGRYASVRATCLTTALVLAWLLGRWGVAATLRIGVARRDGELAAHAWLEGQGAGMLGPAGGDGYEPLVSRGTEDG